jgi:endoglucanase Acf2
LAVVVTLACGCSHTVNPRAVSPAPLGRNVSVGPGYYLLDPPPGARIATDAQGNAVAPKMGAAFTGVPVSSKWWSSLMWPFNPDNHYSLDLYAHPLALRAQSEGLGVSYPTTAAVQPREYMYRYSRDLLVGLEGLRATDAKVVAYSDWAVTVEWRAVGCSLRATFGHGFPFAYFEREGTAPATATFDGSPLIDAERGSAIGLTVGDHHYALFAPTGAKWERTTQGFRSNLSGKRVFSVAVLPDADPATLALFQEHAFAFVRDTRVGWQYDEKKAELVTSYEAVTELVDDCGLPCAQRSHDPIWALYRHQWLNSDAKVLSRAEYTSPRGTMKTIVAPSFQTRMKLNGVLPILPNASDASLRHYVDKVWEEREHFPVGLGPQPERDVYWEGKSFGRLANVVEIADQQGMTDAKEGLLQAMKNEFEDWFDGREPRMLYYDGAWRSLVAFPASYGSAEQLNDHHFHYGYFIQAAETIARFDPDWAKKWGSCVELLIKDAANWDRKDTRFPFLRHMDPYAGHSWASGPAQFPEGNNQEASSEDINLSYAIIMWGVNTGNREIRDLGIYLYTNQVSAAEQYWFDVDREVFPKAFGHSLAAMVWGAGAKYDTWFDQDPVMVHGINVLPFHGGSLYFGRRPDYVSRNFDSLVNLSHGEITTWRDYMLMYLATSDAERAADLFGQDTLFEPEFGNSMAMTRHWVFNLRALGRLDTATTADTPTYAVFTDRAGKRTHVAYNGAGVPREVEFSDGVTLSVPPRQLAFKGP